MSSGNRKIFQQVQYDQCIFVKGFSYIFFLEFQLFEARFLNMKSEKRRYLNELSKIGKEILELKNKQELDNTVIYLLILRK